MHFLLFHSAGWFLYFTGTPGGTTELPTCIELMFPGGSLWPDLGQVSKPTTQDGPQTPQPWLPSLLQLALGSSRVSVVWPLYSGHMTYPIYNDPPPSFSAPRLCMVVPSLSYSILRFTSMCLLCFPCEDVNSIRTAVVFVCLFVSCLLFCP